MPASLPDYDSMAAALADSKLAPSPAEAQGMLCGLLAQAVDKVLQRFQAELLDGGADDNCRVLLDELAEYTRMQLADGSEGFDLMLPADDSALAKRAIAITDWCRGFIYAVGLAGTSGYDAMSAEAQEVLRDFTELTRLDADDLDDGEDNEQALMEIVEFVRVAAMSLCADSAKRAKYPGAA